MAWYSDGAVASRSIVLESPWEANQTETADLWESGHLLQVGKAADSIEGLCSAAEGPNVAGALDLAFPADADLMDRSGNMAGVVPRRTLRSCRGRVGDSAEGGDFQCCRGGPGLEGWWLRRNLGRPSVMLTLRADGGEF